MWVCFINEFYENYMIMVNGKKRTITLERIVKFTLGPKGLNFRSIVSHYFLLLNTVGRYRKITNSFSDFGCCANGESYWSNHFQLTSKMRNILILLILALLNTCHRPSRNSNEKEQPINGKSIANPDSSTKKKEGLVYFSGNYGLTWENRSEGLPDSADIGLGAIAVTGNSLALATKAHGIYMFDFQKNSWIPLPTDQLIMESHPGALAFYKDGLYIGTQLRGVFCTKDQGKNWTNRNTGLDHLTIRKLIEIDQTLYAGTNAGLYSYSENLNKWELEFGNPTLQVNGITALKNDIYIGTNQGAFRSPKGRKDWQHVLMNRSLHNIGSDELTIYAMTYNELLASSDNGESWQSIQKGLPAQLYTFNVIKNGPFVFAGQWDGVYRKEATDPVWKSYINGLQRQFAVTNMALSRGMIVISTSERKLRKGMTIP